MKRWPHQITGHAETLAAIARGARRLCVTSPTGGGKGLMLQEMLEWAAENSMPAVLYTDRRILFEQTAERLDNAGIQYGRRASGHEPRLDMPLQLAMVQTEFSKVHKTEKWLPHHARIAIVDEGHKFTGGQAQKIIEGHLASGAVVIYYTATPVGMAGICDELIVAGCNSELRACGALVAAITYAPDEPDWNNLKGPFGEDFSEQQLFAEFCKVPLFGRVCDWYDRLNPNRRPSILFGPSVRGSQWFAERFSAKGISAAHIDGDDVWVNGESYTSNQEVRDEVMRRFRSGEINILCNRFVLREGWDCPEVAHCIFATTFGSIQSYLQSGGRVLRAHPSIQSVVVQDHGGNWLRHGSLNADRIWSLDDTSKSLAEARRDELRQKNSEPDSHVGEDGEPMVCPNCYRPRRVVIGQDNSVCPYCDHRCSKKSRYVRQIDGTLKRVWGDAYRLPVRKAIPDDQKKWQQVYFSCKNSGKTFKQAEGWFFRQYRAWPRLDMKYMPKNREDFTRRIKDVPNHNLHGFDR